MVGQLGARPAQERIDHAYAVVAMADASSSPPARERSRASIQRVPLWVRWVVSFAVFAALLVALVVYVNANNTDTPTGVQNPATEVEANRQATILVEQDQAPRTASLARGVAPATALAHAIRADMDKEIAQQVVAGPVTRSSCARTGPGGRVTASFSCTVVANSLAYPFEGVVDTRTRVITFCKRDPPPVPSENIPLSRRCTG